MAEDVTKLPKWAQDKIKYLEMQRDAAVKALNEYVDNQTFSAFSYMDILSVGEKAGPSFKKVYIQTHKMNIVHAGVELDILLREDRIDLSWGTDKSRTREIAFVPTSYQAAKLVSKEFIS